MYGSGALQCSMIPTHLVFQSEKYTDVSITSESSIEDAGKFITVN